MSRYYTATRNTQSASTQLLVDKFAMKMAEHATYKLAPKDPRMYRRTFLASENNRIDAYGLVRGLRSQIPLNR